MNVETMRLLVAKGLSAADILEIAETLDCAPAPRSSGAERQARYRARKAEAKATRDVTSDVTSDGDSDATDVTPPALPLPPNENNSNPPTPTHPDVDTPRTRKAHRFPAEFPCPEWAEPAVWADLLKNRKAKRLPNTGTAHEQFVKAVEGLADPDWPPGRLLKAIVARGWGGAYDPRENRNDRTVPTSRNPDAWRGSASRSSQHADGFTQELTDIAFGRRPAHG